MKHTVLLTCLLLILLSCFCSCLNYQRYLMPVQRLQNVPVESASVYVIDAAHPLTKVWYVAEAEVKKDKLGGFLTRLTDVDALEVSIMRNTRDAKNSRNDMLIYVNPRLIMGFSDTLTTYIPLTQIERIEVHEPNYGKSIGLAVATLGGFFFITSYLQLQNQ